MSVPIASSDSSKGAAGQGSGFWRANLPQPSDVGQPDPNIQDVPEQASSQPSPTDGRRDRAALFEMPMPPMAPPPLPDFGRRDRPAPAPVQSFAQTFGDNAGGSDAIALMAERSALKKRITQLEEALEECRATLELQLLHAQAQDDLLTQQGEEMEAASATVEGLLGELESLRDDAEQQLTRLQDEIGQLQQRSEMAEARVAELETLLSQREQDGQRQGILTETLSRQLEASQARVAQLERACALLQQRNLERATQLAQAEQLGQELRSRLHRQQRQTLQFRAALEQCLDLQGRQHIPDVVAADEPDSVLAELLDQGAVDGDATPADQISLEAAEVSGDRGGIHPWAPLAAAASDQDLPPQADPAISPLVRVELPSFGHSGSLVRDGALKAEEILALLDWQLDRRGEPDRADVAPAAAEPAAKTNEAVESPAQPPVNRDRPRGVIRVGLWDEKTEEPGVHRDRDDDHNSTDALPPIAQILEDGADLLAPERPRDRQPLNLPEPHAIAAPVPVPERRASAPILPSDVAGRRRRPSLAAVELPRFR
ncbi:MAG: hypothetical protein Fur0042_06190 [Cyanophyceae cyanobacterium]